MNKLCSENSSFSINCSQTYSYDSKSASPPWTLITIHIGRNSYKVIYAPYLAIEHIGKSRYKSSFQLRVQVLAVSHCGPNYSNISRAGSDAFMILWGLKH